MAKLWEKYGVYVIAAASSSLPSSADLNSGKARQLARAEAAGAQYEAALQLCRTGKADEAQELLRSHRRTAGQAGYAALAELTLAGSQLKAGKSEDALGDFREARPGRRAPIRLLASFARLQAASLRLGDADFTEMQNRLNAFGRRKSPWRYNARELLGHGGAEGGQARRGTCRAFAASRRSQRSRDDAVERVRRMMASSRRRKWRRPPRLRRQRRGLSRPTRTRAADRAKLNRHRNRRPPA